MSDLGLLIARVMMSLVFLFSGFDKALHWSAGLAEVGATGLPLAPLMLAATIVTQLGGGLSLALGLWTRLGALALAGFTAFATVLVHHFWNAETGAWQHEFTTFMEHVALIGGFLAIMIIGPGSLSLDWRFWPAPLDRLSKVALR